MYKVPTISFQPKKFLEFTNVVANTSCKIIQDWVNNLNDGTKHLAFHIIGQSHMVHYVDSVIGMHSTFTQEGFDQAIKFVKIQCITM
jgi:hypothetical protein